MDERTDNSEWLRLGDLFDHAIGLGPEEQTELVRKVAIDDADLAQALQSLLAADARHNENTAEHRALVLKNSLQALEVTTTIPGDRVGPYLLCEELGRGGMGVVFRAERHDGQVRQEVALKIVKRSVLEAGGLARFLRERQIVAGFQHPYIARMLDVGETADGSPWLAMELVRGATITAWCDARRLDSRGRVALFVRVCEAVQHAHANLVLHRDLKPGNVLVGEDGLPRLIDFGIAKPLPVAADGGPTRTATAHRFYSPGNVAPEQLLGEPVGVACDIYQLGTLLHELLCGAPVFDSAGLTPAQFERRILESEPRAPSTHAARAGEALVRRHGATSAAVLAGSLRGSLDAIVARALRKSPRERYPSAEAMADDLRSHLEGRPVRAARGLFGHRLRDQLRRRATPIAACAMALALSAAFAAAMR